MRKKTKVFGIGFHKTGTSSLADALSILGYRVTGTFGVRNPDISETARELAIPLVEQYDAFQDNPWPLLYEFLDNTYPDSRFILTLRPTDEWLKSAVRHFGTKHTPMREWIYGVGWPVGNEEIYAERYKRHNREVLEYFRHRKDDLLVMHLTAGDGWNKLCPFLDEKIPSLAFPHTNAANDREQKAIVRGDNRGEQSKSLGSVLYRGIVKWKSRISRRN